MNYINITNIIILLTYILAGCVTNPKVSPSQNKALNSISKSSAEKKQSYFLQKKTDEFLEHEWKEKVLEDKEIKATKKSKSNISKLDSMPVIRE